MPRAQKRIQLEGLGNLRHIDWLLRNEVHQPSKGYENQKRFLRILRDHLECNPRPVPWVYAIRQASDREDRRWGIDYVILSDVGDLFLQIKSSEEAKAAFEDETRRRWKRGIRIAILRVVVVNDALTDDQIFRSARKELRDLRRTVRGHGSNFVQWETG